MFRHGYASERTLLTHDAQAVMIKPDPAGALALLGRGLETVLVTVAPLFAAAVIAAIAVNLAQTGIAFKKVKVDLKRINPRTGIKRLLSPQGLFNLLKSLLKLAIMSVLAYEQFRTLGPAILQSGGLPSTSLAALAARKALNFVRVVAVVGLIIGIIDYVLQRRRINKSLMMTKQEIKEDMKHQEGSPEIKGAIRRRQVKMSRLRMMAEVARADVVIVNPTHVAVALRYEAGNGAPKVVAKGADEVAAAIREEAARHDVPIVEDVPLARTIWQACEIDDEIPADLFEAVARVLAFLYRIRATGVRPIGGGPLRVPVRL